MTTTMINNEITRLQREVEFLNERVSFWRAQAIAAQRRKAELYSMLMDIRAQIDRAFSSQPEEATQK